VSWDLHPYFLAKAYAWKGMVLPKSFIRELASSKSLSEFVDALKATPYSQEMQALTQPINALKVEHALRRRLVKTHYRLMNGYKKNRVLVALFSRHVARDFKTILRGLHAGIRGEDLARLVDPYAEELLGIRDVIARLLAAENVKEALGVLSTFAGDDSVPLIFAEATEPLALELEIDRWVLLRLREGLKKTPRRWRPSLSHLIEPLYLGFILTSILRAKIWGLQERKIQQLVEGFIDPSIMPIISTTIEAKDVEEVKRALSVLPKGSLPTISETGTLTGLVNALQTGYHAMLLLRASRSFLRPYDEPSLSVAVVLLLEEEVSRLVGLAAGIEQGLTPTELLDSLSLLA